MVNWKTTESTDRLIASLIAANPGIKLEYQAMATLFGQGATYDAIEGRFRRYRKMADELRAHALSQGITELPRGRNGTVSVSTSTSVSAAASTSSTPRTPRGPRGGITKPTSSSASASASASSARSRRSGVRTRNVLGPGTPSKRGGVRGGLSLMDAIFVDVEAEAEEDVKEDVKAEVEMEMEMDMAMMEEHKEAVEILSGSGFGVGVGVGGRGGMQGRGRGHGRVHTHTHTHGHAQGVSMKFENGEGFVHGGADAVGVADLEQDAFDITGLSFLHGQGAYTMDNIYGGVA